MAKLSTFWPRFKRPEVLDEAKKWSKVSKEASAVASEQHLWFKSVLGWVTI